MRPRFHRTPPHSLLLIVAGLLTGSLVSAQPSPLAAGDAAWARRAVGYVDGKVDPRPIRESITSYELVWRQDSERLDAAWKLLRALQFEGQFVARSSEEKKKIFDRARGVAERALDRLARPHGGRQKLDAMPPARVASTLAATREAAPLYLWSAINWGLWGEVFGPISAARQGAGDRIRRYAETALALDPNLDQAGARRVLGRLHARAPKIPFFTGWVDRNRAISELRLAYAAAPENFHNQLFLAEALLDHQPERRDEALRLLRGLVNNPSPPEASLVEASNALAQARQRLAKER